jgi:hypothetical protein
MNKCTIKNWKQRSKNSLLGEDQYGGEGPRWTVVPSKKKKKKKVMPIIVSDVPSRINRIL